MYYLNPRIKNLNRIFDQNGRSDFLRLDLNENPGGLPKELVDKALSKITPELIAEYPETEHFEKTLAKHLHTDPSHFCLVNGSAEGIRYIFEAFTSEGGQVVGVVPSYFMFQIYSEMYGRKFIPVPYDNNLKMDIKTIISKLNDDTQLLILLNPNNPMGNTYTEDEFQTILSTAKEKHITVLVDEAYHYFYPKTFIKYALENEHVFVTRTFSKLFSMAGCRLGYVVGHPEGIKMIQKLCTPHNINVFALQIARTVLETPGAIDGLINDFNEGRNYLIEWLDSNSYQHVGEAGNFIFVKPKTNADKIVEKMKKEKKILIKSYPNVGKLGDCLRISIGNKNFMEIFTKALQEIDK